MKKLITIIIFGYTLTHLAACTKSERLLKKIDGSWQIESITFSRSGGKTDTILTKSLGTLVFNTCQDPNGNQVPVCEGKFIDTNNEIMPLTFQVSNVGSGNTEDKLTISERATATRPEQCWGGIYVATELNTKKLNFEGKYVNLTERIPMTTYCRIKTTKIE